MARSPRARRAHVPPLAAVLFLLAVPLTAQERGIWVANANGDSVTGYESTVGGNQPPDQEFTGTPTPLELASSVAADAGREEIFVALRTFDSVAVFDFGASGPSMPLRTLTGAATTIDTAWDVEVDHERGELYVLSKDASQILVFPITASGNTAPIRTIETAPPWDPLTFDFDLDLVNDEIVVVDRTPGAVGIRFFPLDADGTVAPLRSIAGPATGLTAPNTVAVDPVHGEVFVAQTTSVRAFARTASGNVAPLRTISGAATGFNASAGGLDVDPVLGEVAVLRSNPDAAILFFARTASGDMAPLRVIVGAATHLNGPSRLSYFPFLVFADGFERGDATAWSTAVP